MKVGDSLLSKKIFNTYTRVNFTFEPNKIYYIRAISNENLNHAEQIFMSTSPEFNQGYWFTLDPKRDYNDLYLYDYFYTKKETRKLKLQNLNEEI